MSEETKRLKGETRNKQKLTLTENQITLRHVKKCRHKISNKNYKYYRANLKWQWVGDVARQRAERWTLKRPRPKSQKEELEDDIKKISQITCRPNWFQLTRNLIGRPIISSGLEHADEEEAKVYTIS